MGAILLQAGHADGAVVKTIGDAVMAAFADPVKAVSAALAIQARVSEFNAAQGEPAISIKLGLHQGPCIAVTLPSGSTQCHTRRASRTSAHGWPCRVRRSRASEIPESGGHGGVPHLYREAI